MLLAGKAGSNSLLGQLLLSYHDYLSLLADEELWLEIKVKASPSDLVQESFVEAKRDFEQFAGNTTEEFQAWLRRLLLNHVANVIRSYHGTEKRDVSREVPDSQFAGDQRKPLSDQYKSASSIVVRNELLDALQTALRKLPGHYQDVIQWRNYDRASFEQIGQQLNRSAEGTRKLWVRAVKILQQELDAGNDTLILKPGTIWSGLDGSGSEVRSTAGSV